MTWRRARAALARRRPCSSGPAAGVEQPVADDAGGRRRRWRRAADGRRRVLTGCSPGARRRRRRRGSRLVVQHRAGRARDVVRHEARRPWRPSALGAMPSRRRSPVDRREIQHFAAGRGARSDGQTQPQAGHGRRPACAARWRALPEAAATTVGLRPPPVAAHGRRHRLVRRRRPQAVRLRAQRSARRAPERLQPPRPRRHVPSDQRRPPASRRDARHGAQRDRPAATVAEDDTDASDRRSRASTATCARAVRTVAGRRWTGAGLRCAPSSSHGLRRPGPPREAQRRPGRDAALGLQRRGRQAAVRTAPQLPRRACRGAPRRIGGRHWRAAGTGTSPSVERLGGWLECAAHGAEASRSASSSMPFCASPATSSR